MSSVHRNLAAGGAFVTYFIGSLIGFPSIPPEGVEALLEPPGVLAKIVEHGRVSL